MERNTPFFSRFYIQNYNFLEALFFEQLHLHHQMSQNQNLNCSIKGLHLLNLVIFVGIYLGTNVEYMTLVKLYSYNC
jgi:hypothetical protein